MNDTLQRIDEALAGGEEITIAELAKMLNLSKGYCGKVVRGAQTRYILKKRIERTQHGDINCKRTLLVVSKRACARSE